MFKRLGVIGCGLIGCSFAMAVKKAGVVERIIGYSKSPTTTSQALAAGILDETAPSAMQAVSGSDVVFIAVPVGAMAKIFSEIAPLISSDTLLMDAGSTKQDVITAAVDILGRKIGSFVPAHPIAGKTYAGFRAAEAGLFAGHKVILTPLEETRQEQLGNAVKIWRAIGAVVRLTSAKDHDASMAAVSHLPHLIAFAYMNGLLDQPQCEHFLSLAGTGFQDFSRIAGSDATLWHDVFLANRRELQYQINAFKASLSQLEQFLSSNDENGLLCKSIRRASNARSAWSLGEIPMMDSAEQQASSGEESQQLGLIQRLIGAFRGTPHSQS